MDRCALAHFLGWLNGAGYVIVDRDQLTWTFLRSAPDLEEFVLGYPDTDHAASGDPVAAYEAGYSVGRATSAARTTTTPERITP